MTSQTSPLTAHQLTGLTAEQLVRHVRSRTDVTSPSHYLREAHVPAVRIETYPKRRRITAAPRLAPVAVAPRAAVVPAEPTYADFLVAPSRQLASA